MRTMATSIWTICFRDASEVRVARRFRFFARVIFVLLSSKRGPFSPSPARWDGKRDGRWYLKGDLDGEEAAVGAAVDGGDAAADGDAVGLRLRQAVRAVLPAPLTAAQSPILTRVPSSQPAAMREGV